MHFVCLWLDKAQAICGKPRILSGLPLGIKIWVPGLHAMRHFRGGGGGIQFSFCSSGYPY